MNLHKIARQKIVDIKGNVVSYEMLYRNQHLEEKELTDDEKTLDVLKTIEMIGFDKVSNGLKLSLNFSDTNLIESISEKLSPEKISLEILETVEINSAFVERMKILKEKGFSIYLDDFDKSKVKDESIYNLVDVVKVDFMLSTKEDFEFVLELKNKFPNLKLLAEKVENKKEYKYALENGYSYFQGYFIEKPEEMICDSKIL